MRTVAVVLAGGSGVRLGGNTPKQLQLLAGRTLLEHSVAAFDAAPGIDEVVVVMPAELIGEAKRILDADCRKVSHIIAGGTAGPGSTRQGIEVLSRDVGNSADADCNVLFHDAARPRVDQRIIADCVSGLADSQALGVVLPTADPIVEVTDGVMTSIPPRESLGRCQTPQGFRLSVIRRAHELAAADPEQGASQPIPDSGIRPRAPPEIGVRVVPRSD